MKTREGKEKTEPKFRLYECAHGRRWSVKWDKTEYDGQPCNFSGCRPGHKVRLVRLADDVPKDWFRGWKDGISPTHAKLCRGGCGDHKFCEQVYRTYVNMMGFRKAEGREGR